MSNKRFYSKAIQCILSKLGLRQKESERYIIEKAIQYLMSKHGIEWSLNGVYKRLEDKEVKQ